MSGRSGRDAARSLSERWCILDAKGTAGVQSTRHARAGYCEPKEAGASGATSNLAKYNFGNFETLPSVPGRHAPKAFARLCEGSNALVTKTSFWLRKSARIH